MHDSDQGLAWGNTRLEGTSSQVDIDFDFRLGSICRFRVYEPDFVPWLQDWDTDVSRWKWSILKRQDPCIEDMDFFQRFQENFPTAQHRTELLGALRRQYTPKTKKK